MLASQDGVALADRTYLSVSQMDSTYGASASEVSAVTQYIQAAGLNVHYTYQGAGTVRVFGPPSSFALAFGVKPLAGYGNDTLNLPWTYNGSTLPTRVAPGHRHRDDPGVARPERLARPVSIGHRHRLADRHGNPADGLVRLADRAGSGGQPGLQLPHRDLGPGRRA